MRSAALWLALLAGCPKKTSDPGATGSDPSRPAPVQPPGDKLSGMRSGATLEMQGSAPTPAPAPAPASLAPPVASLPRAIDVLPKDTVGDREARLFAGDRFRFQVPADFAPVDHPSKAAYRGTRKGMGSDAQLTLWAAAEPFDGDLAALAAREQAAIKGAGGAVTLDSPVELGGKPARRLVGKLADRYDMQLLAVRDKRAYIFHCETPNVRDAWSNIGSECLTRGGAFEVGLSVR